jgi:FAD/FMN-containing dehydrogenase
MKIKQKNFYNLQDLQDFIKTHTPALYVGSKTSTVIPFDHLEDHFKEIPEGFTLANLSHMPKTLKLTDQGHLVVQGGVTWDEARQFLQSHNRNLKLYPTEILANVLSGVATSCTGERSFGYGNLRKQIVSLKYLNYKGEIVSLHRDQELNHLNQHELFQTYQNDFARYIHFKNAPYPRLEKATDLMIGTEGQLGVVIEAEIETALNDHVAYMFCLLPPWEDNFEPHLELFHEIQKYRGKVLACELVDHHSISYLDKKDQLGVNQDVIFLEILRKDFDEVFEALNSHLKLIHSDQMFEIFREKYHHTRASVPRQIFERNHQMGVVKMGTDVQVAPTHFGYLLKFYQEAKQVGIKYNLFGHFGDGHLHFNFMPTKDEIPKCQDYFLKLYDKVLEWKGSPFAEHGIGLLKRKYIESYQGKTQKEVFKILKKEHDPHNQFFPQGFMS